MKMEVVASGKWQGRTRSICRTNEEGKKERTKQPKSMKLLIVRVKIRISSEKLKEDNVSVTKNKPPPAFQIKRGTKKTNAEKIID